MTPFESTPYKIEIEVYRGRYWKLFINGKEIDATKFSIELDREKTLEYGVSYDLTANTVFDIFDGNKPVFED